MHMHMGVQTWHWCFQSWGTDCGTKTNETVSYTYIYIHIYTYVYPVMHNRVPEPHSEMIFRAGSLRAGPGLHRANWTFQARTGPVWGIPGSQGISGSHSTSMVRIWSRNTFRMSLSPSLDNAFLMRPQNAKENKNEHKYIYIYIYIYMYRGGPITWIHLFHSRAWRPKTLII